MQEQGFRLGIYLDTSIYHIYQSFTHNNWSAMDHGRRTELPRKPQCGEEVFPRWNMLRADGHFRSHWEISITQTLITFSYIITWRHQVVLFAAFSKIPSVWAVRAGSSCGGTHVSNPNLRFYIYTTDGTDRTGKWYELEYYNILTITWGVLSCLLIKSVYCNLWTDKLRMLP